LYFGLIAIAYDKGLLTVGKENKTVYFGKLERWLFNYLSSKTTSSEVNPILRNVAKVLIENNAYLNKKYTNTYKPKPTATQEIELPTQEEVNCEEPAISEETN
jgi:glutathione peroxidase-family protein